MHTVTILIYHKQSDRGFIPVTNCRQRHTMKHGNLKIFKDFKREI